MELQVKPPRLMPLHVVGWLSIPWRHWGYISGSLFFGLLFLTFSAAPFLVRLLAILVPFVIALGLAFPYGGLHMDEWIALAWRYARRPGVRERLPVEQDEDGLPEEPDTEDDTAGEEPPAADLPGAQDAAWPAPPLAWLRQPDLPADWAGPEVWITSGAPAAPLPRAPSDSAFVGTASISWQAPTTPPEPGPPPSPLTTPGTLRKSGVRFAADRFLLDQPSGKLRAHPRRKRW